VIADVAPEPKTAEDVKKLYKNTTQGIEASDFVKQVLDK
jgi:hypothetical protein